MDEETSTPYLDWEYVLMGPDGPWDGGFRRPVDSPPVGEWHIEFQGRTRGNELLLAQSVPPPDRDAGEWLEAFESGSIEAIRLSIDSYFGPQPDENNDDPDADPYPPDPDLEDVEHTIFIGDGWARREGSNLLVTILSEVFRDATASLLLGIGSKYEGIEKRIFQLYTLIDPDNFSRFLASLQEMDAPPSTEAYRVRRPRKASYAHRELTRAQMISLLKRPDGGVSYEQFHTYLRTQPRTVRGWMEKAKLFEVRPQRLTDHVITSGEILTRFAPWIKNHLTTPGVQEFYTSLLVEKLIQR